MAGRFIDATLRFVDNFTGPMRQAMGQMQQNGRTFVRAGKQIEAAGKNITNAGKAMTNAVTVPIVGMGIAAVKTAADFESAMSKVASISGDTGAATKELVALADEMGLSYQKNADGSASAMEILGAKALQMGAKTKFSATEAADAFSYMAMAGWDTQSMMEGIEGIMYLAGATGEDLAATSDIVTDALTAFGMKANETNRFVDVLAQAANRSNTDVSLMGETFKYVAPVAGALGYSVEDTAVAIGLMANSGIKASNAGTALRSLFTNLAKPTDTMAIAMEKLGISLTDSEGAMKPFNQLMIEMRSAFSGLTEAEKAQYAATLAGKTGMSGMLAIVNASEDDFNKLTVAMGESTGAAKAMYDVANDNLNGRLTILKSTLESIAITFGEKLMPYVEIGVEKLQALADKFSSLSSEQVGNIIKWAAIAAAIGPAIMLFGKAVTFIGSAIVAIGKFKLAAAAAGGIMPLLTGPVGIAVMVVAGLTAAGILLYKNWDKVKQFLIGFGKNIKSIFNESGQSIGGFGEKIGDIKEKFSGIISGAKEIWEIAGPYIEKFGEIAKLVFQVHLGAFIGGAVGLFNAVADSVLDIVDGIMVSLGGLIEFIAGVFTGDWERAWGGIVEFFGGGFASLVELAKAPVNAVIGIINGAVSQINKLGIKIPDWVPKFGGEDFSINLPTLTYLYKGTNNWGGGPAMIHDRGAEIVDLPKGTRVYPHDKSLEMARAEGARSTTINVPKLADTIIVREEADIDKIMNAFVKKVEEVAPNMS